LSAGKGSASARSRGFELEAVWYGERRAGWMLRPLGVLYCAAAAIRRAAFRLGLRRVVELPVPVVIVGNLTVGGTGKTPCVVWLAGRLAERGIRAGIVSRGYGGRKGATPQRVAADSDPAVVGDEPVLLARRSGCPVVVAADRVAAARRLLSEEKVDVLLADDGLQHYRLGRAFEIAVVDGTRGLGNGLCLPAGPLREPPRRLRGVDAVIVNGPGWGYPAAYRADLTPSRVYRLADERETTLTSFSGQTVHAVAGIGNPQRFFAMLEEAGLRVVRHPLPDHAEISPADLSFDRPGPVLITEKDAVKCRFLARHEVWCVTVDMRLAPDDEQRLLGRILTRLQGSSRS
jgi:tetraacyldisaccharide 4'-kinase